MSVVLYVVIVIIIFTLAIGLYTKSNNAICLSKKRLDGRTVIVTGGTAGMGLEIAKDFADRGARVVIACPFPEEGESAQKYIAEETDNKEVIFKLLDLSSIASVRRFVNEINETEERLDILINNAGVGAVKDFITKDGMSFIMQVNYFGHFLLTLLLLPLLKQTASPTEPTRIVNTSSVTHNLGIINIDKLNDIKYWYSIPLYSNSKLCQMVFTHELSKRLKGLNIIVNCVDPGLVGTRIYESYEKFLGIYIKWWLNILSKTPWEGAQTAIHVALDKKAGLVNGQMFKNCKLSRAKKAAYDDNTARRLWDESVKLVGLSDKEVKQFSVD